MMKRALAVGLFVVAVAGCKGQEEGVAVSAEESQGLLNDRTWIDRMPETERDRLHAFRFIPSMGSGIYQDRTLYAGQFELFRYEATGEQIRFDLPHKGERSTVKYRIEDVKKKPFDLRLTIDRSPRGPSVYYSSRRWSGEQDLARLLDEK